MTNLAHESDFQRKVDDVEGGTFLPGTNIEIIREPAMRGQYKHVLFDFDGTLSLIREGWTGVMVGMMVEILLGTPNHESAEDLEATVREFVSRLTGKQTIYQMIQLVEEISKRGGRPLEPVDYKHMYLDRLMERIKNRRESLRCGAASPDDMLVPGTYELLGALRDRGLPMYLASGTDEPFVKEEADLVGLMPYFVDHVYGALDDYRSFSKAMVIERILRENHVEGAYLLGFGDAYVEIDNVKSAGGTAVGVATDEAECSGKPDAWKRDRLIAVGADIVIPDYRESARLVEYLFP